MLVAAAVCPHPPLLIPEAVGAAGQDDAAGSGPGTDAWIGELRAACRAAVAILAAAQPDLIAVVGGGPETVAYPESACGSLHRLGIPYATGTGPPVLPLSLTIGAWLLRGPPVVGPRVYLQAVESAIPAADCLRLGGELAQRAPRVALLAMGDGTARRATGVPGAPDPPAQAYDAQVAAAVAAADVRALARLDPALDAELLVVGRPAWQILAGAVLAQATTPAAASRFRSRVIFAAAPLGVSYLVATWDA